MRWNNILGILTDCFIIRSENAVNITTCEWLEIFNSLNSFLKSLKSGSENHLRSRFEETIGKLYNEKYQHERILKLFAIASRDKLS